MANFDHYTSPPPEPPERPSPNRRMPSRRMIVLLIVAVVGCAGLWVLATLFPGRLGQNGSGAVYALGMLVIVGSSLAARRLPLGQTVRYALIWGAIIAVLVLGVTCWSSVERVGNQVRSALIPGYAVAGAAHEMVVSQDENGSYYVVGQVNGKAVTFLVDTGASDVVLTPADARRLGVDTAHIRFDHPYETANGEGRGASWRADSLRVGQIGYSDVEMSVNQAPMSNSLLGMSFFRRLQSFRFEGGKLIMKGKG